MRTLSYLICVWIWVLLSSCNTAKNQGNKSMEASQNTVELKPLTEVSDKKDAEVNESLFVSGEVIIKMADEAKERILFPNEGPSIGPHPLASEIEQYQIQQIRKVSPGLDLALYKIMFTEENNTDALIKALLAKSFIASAERIPLQN